MSMLAVAFPTLNEEKQRRRSSSQKLRDMVVLLHIEVFVAPCRSCATCWCFCTLRYP
jgi:hypothetical protein